MEKNVIVVDTFGNEVGRTYVKRAKGLVKSGRAEIINENTIRMIQKPVDNIYMKGNFYMNTILFNSRDFKGTDYADRTFISDADGQMTEVFTIGDWNKAHKAVITSKPVKVDEGENRVVFWLNGGENEDKDEICQLQIIPTEYVDGQISEDEEEFKLIYKLNRNFVKPMKKIKGWNLYSIPFSADDKSFVVLRFVAEGAYTTIKSAKAPEEYADLKNVTDKYEQYRPLRHNIVFEDGWDNDKDYATRFLREVWGDGDDGIWTQSSAIDQDTLDAWAKSLGEFARKVGEGAKDFGGKAVEAGKEAGEKYGPTVKEVGKKAGEKAVQLGKEGASIAKKGMDKLMANEAVKSTMDKIGAFFTAPKAEEGEETEAVETPEAPEEVTENANSCENAQTSDSADSSVDL